MEDQLATLTISGDIYRQTHRASILGVLGEKAPPVSSRGNTFFNRNRWTLHYFVLNLCDWAIKHPKKTPTYSDVASWVFSANRRRVPNPEIVIANTPDHLPTPVALALTGGAYHEAWHILYTCKRDLSTDEIFDLLIQKWAQVPDWSVVGNALTVWYNLLEDIRIERLGCLEFEGARSKMPFLQDFILNSESSCSTTSSIIAKTFRDAGLGYETPRQQEAFCSYQENNPAAVDLVLKGPLYPLLQEAQAPTKTDLLNSLWLAMDVMICLEQTSIETSQIPQIQSEDNPLDSGCDSLGIKSLNVALEGAFSEALSVEAALQEGEERWNPYDPEADEVCIVKESKEGREADGIRVKRILSEMLSEVCYLRSRLRNLIQAMRLTSTIYGVPRGTRLSSRNLVDTKLSLMNHQDPRKAYVAPGVQREVSFATVVLMDESSSMISMKSAATKLFCALTEPLDGLGCATLAVGFRYGTKEKGGTQEGGHHRYRNVRFDLFKKWEERFALVQWRFANTIACGKTPTADGLQFALNAIKHRQETHKIIFVITDGKPDEGHDKIIKRQIRIAEEVGIHIIGVGLGEASRPVSTLFEDFIWAKEVLEAPKMLMEKLNQILDKTGGFR